MHNKISILNTNVNSCDSLLLFIILLTLFHLSCNYHCCYYFETWFSQLKIQIKSTKHRIKPNASEGQEPQITNQQNYIFRGKILSTYIYTQKNIIYNFTLFFIKKKRNFIGEFQLTQNGEQNQLLQKKLGFNFHSNQRHLLYPTNLV